MNIPFQGQISKTDLSEIFTLALKSQRWIAYIFGPLFLVFTTILIFSIFTNIYSPIWLMATAFTGVFASFPFWSPALNATNAYQRQTEFRGMYSGAVSEDEIILRTINTTSNVRWKLFRIVVRNGKYVLLYQNSRCFNFFPRSFFATKEDWQAFNNLLDQKVKSGELKETTGKPDLSLGTTLPGWIMILAVAVLALPLFGFIIVLTVKIINGVGN